MKASEAKAELSAAAAVMPTPASRGCELFRLLAFEPPDKWPSFVSRLDPPQIDSLIVHLVAKGHPQTTIADKLGLALSRVREVWRNSAEDLGSSVLGFSLPLIVGRLEARADELIHLAVEDDKPNLAWTIEKQRVQLLQDLGVVERAAKRHEVQVVHSIDNSTDEVRREMQMMLELEKKRLVSVERTKRIEAKVLDSVQGTLSPLSDDDADEAV